MTVLVYGEDIFVAVLVVKAVFVVTVVIDATHHHALRQDAEEHILDTLQSIRRIWYLAVLSPKLSCGPAVRPYSAWPFSRARHPR